MLAMSYAIHDPVSSSYISEVQATNIIWAATYAYCAGKPLNRYVVLRFDDQSQAQSKLTAFIKRISDWLRYHSSDPPYYVRTLEAKGGIHVNLLIHIPSHLHSEFRKLSHGWVCQIGLAAHKDRIRSKRIRCSAPGNDPYDYLTRGLRGLLRYVLKGIDPACAKRFGIEPEAQGEILGKRCARSESLGAEHYVFPQQRYKSRNLWTPGAQSIRMRLVEIAWHCEDDDPLGQFPILPMRMRKMVIHAPSDSN